ncbi:hypothetical protein TNCV_4502561 [Trichonephila clavipes]|nr:hypothetical protein TNCV_4502561 [Trichonephila clavipes]
MAYSIGGKFNEQQVEHCTEWLLTGSPLTVGQTLLNRAVKVPENTIMREASRVGLSVAPGFAYIVTPSEAYWLMDEGLVVLE